MPWEDRYGHRYYYRARKVSGRTRREYFGKGSRAELAAAADELNRLDREVQRRQLKKEQARNEEAQAPLSRLCEVLDILYRASLVAAHYYCHRRGEWRHRRGHEARE